MAVNLKGVFLTCKYAIPHLIGKKWHIVNISSVAGTVTFKGGGGYCASKFGLMALTDVLTQELKPHEVKGPYPLPRIDFDGVRRGETLRPQTRTSGGDRLANGFGSCRGHLQPNHHAAAGSAGNAEMTLKPKGLPALP